MRAIARTGLHFTESEYDRERYERLLEIAAREYAPVARLPEGAVLDRFRAELGYNTTKVGAEAAVFAPDERLLLVRRADDNCWGLISGWVDSGETPAETVLREFAEETGLDATIDELVGIFARPASVEYGPHATIAVLYLCSITDGEIAWPEHEILEVAWSGIDTVERWHKNHEHYARAALARWRERHAESGS